MTILKSYKTRVIQHNNFKHVFNHFGAPIYGQSEIKKLVQFHKCLTRSKATCMVWCGGNYMISAHGQCVWVRGGEQKINKCAESKTVKYNEFASNDALLHLVD